MSQKHAATARNAPGARRLPGVLLGTAALGLVALFAALLAPGCSESGDAPVPQPPDPVETVTDPPAKEPLTEAEIQQKKAELLGDMDRKARGYMKSFRTRVYDAKRDVGIVAALGEVTVRTRGAKGEATGKFKLTFDGTKHQDLQVAIEPGEGAEDLPAYSREQVLKFAVQSLRGAYHVVVYYYPPNQWLFTRGKDGAAIATAQPFKRPVTVSYRFDERELVAIRGADAPRGTEIAQFEWREWRGRYLLESMQFKGTGTQLTYEYDEFDGAVLMSRGTLDKEGALLDATFRYWGIEKGEPETPPEPEFVTQPPGGVDEPK